MKGTHGGLPSVPAGLPTPQLCGEFHQFFIADAGIIHRARINDSCTLYDSWRFVIEFRRMDIRFNCPHCNQKLAVDQAGTGMTVSCPNCNQPVEIPPAAAVPPPRPVSVAAEPKAMQPSQTRRPRQQTSGLVLLFAHDSSKPNIVAKVDVIDGKTLRVTNGNDAAWDSPTIILNDSFDGPILNISGPWAPNETRELALDIFAGRLSHQRFNPQYENVREVMIDARGFQLGMYPNTTLDGCV